MTKIANIVGHSETLFELRLPDGRWLTIEKDSKNGVIEGIVVCLAEGTDDGEYGDTISREPIWEPEDNA